MTRVEVISGFSDAEVENRVNYWLIKHAHKYSKILSITIAPSMFTEDENIRCYFVATITYTKKK